MRQELAYTDRPLSAIDVQSRVTSQKAGYSLDADFYTDARIYEAERERLFRRRWLFFDHVSRIPEPGSFVVREIAGESIIVVRGEDRRVRAFYNVCRHRGSKVCTEPCGRLRRLVCPYHAWSYELDGRLSAASSMPRDFDPSAHALVSCHARVVEGLVFINLCDGEPPDLDEMIAPFVTLLDFHGIATAKVAHREVIAVAANWKLAVENNLECYHCVKRHPELCSVMSRDYLLTMAAGPGSGEDAAVSRYNQQIAEWEAHAKAFDHPTGIFSDHTTSEHFRFCTRLPINDGYLSLSEGGAPVAPLMGKLDEYDGGRSSLQLDPLTILIASNDHAVIISFVPTGVTETETVLTWLVHPQAREGQDYVLDRLTWLYDRTLRQDKQLLENNQAGVVSSAYRAGRLSMQEATLTHFHQWYRLQMQRETSPGG